MAFERTFTSKKGYKYRALVENYRDEKGRVRQRILKWLGRVGGVHRGTVAYDVQGAFMLGLPFRIVYDLVSGNRLARLRERMSHPNFNRKTADDRRGWRRPTVDAVLAQSKDIWRVSWAREMTRVRSSEEIAKDAEQRMALREFAERIQEAKQPPGDPETRLVALREVNERQWANYNATIAAHFGRVDAANVQYAKEQGLTAPQYGMAPDSAASPATSPDIPSESSPASPESAPESSDTP